MGLVHDNPISADAARCATQHYVNITSMVKHGVSIKWADGAENEKGREVQLKKIDALRDLNWEPFVFYIYGVCYLAFYTY